PAEDEVETLLLERERERARRADRVRAREDAVREQDAAVGAERQALAERLLGLRRPHRDHDDLAAGRRTQRDRVLHGIDVERVQDERNALALERLRLGIEFDRT